MMQHLDIIIPAFLPIGAVIGLGIVVLRNNKENDIRVNSVFKRLDQVKESQADTYVSKDVCQVLHKSLSDKVDKIDRNVERLLDRGDNG